MPTTVLTALEFCRDRIWYCGGSQRFNCGLTVVSLEAPWTLELSQSTQMFGRIGGQAIRCAIRRPVARRKVCDRRFSAHTTSNASPTAIPSPLGSITVELDRIAPRFEIPASQVTILDSPANFYSTLKVCPAEIAMMITHHPAIVNKIISSAVENPQRTPSCLSLDPLYRQDRARAH